jgi:hypothetical protein
MIDCKNVNIVDFAKNGSYFFKSEKNTIKNIKPPSNLPFQLNLISRDYKGFDKKYNKHLKEYCSNALKDDFKREKNYYSKFIMKKIPYTEYDIDDKKNDHEYENDDFINLGIRYSDYDYTLRKNDFVSFKK